MRERRLKFCVWRPVKNGIGAAAEHDDPNWPRYVRITDIAGPRALRDDTFRSLPPEQAVEAPFDVGDILAAAVGATFGKAYLHTRDIGPVAFAGYLVRISPGAEFDTGFMSYWCESQHYWDQLRSNVIQSTVQNFSAAKFAELVVPEHSLHTQRAIADYLDRETARLDTLVAAKERVLGLLFAKRQATISQAVIQGLTPDVPLKDSGVEWLRDVPRAWNVTRLKFLLREPLKYGANEAAELDDPQLPRYVRITDIDENDTLRDETFRSLPVETAEEYLLDEGDVLFARSGATAGKSFLYRASWGKCAFAGYLIRARLQTTRVLPTFLRYFTASTAYWEWLSSVFIQSTIQNVSAEKYADLAVPLPSLSEQVAIVDMLDRTVRQIDVVVSATERSIALIKERRSALISAAVTGALKIA